MPNDRDRVGYAFDIAKIESKTTIWEMQERIAITNIYGSWIALNLSVKD